MFTLYFQLIKWLTAQAEAARQDRKALDTMEYAMLAALIVIAAIVAYRALGQQIVATIMNVVASMNG